MADDEQSDLASMKSAERISVIPSRNDQDLGDDKDTQLIDGGSRKGAGSTTSNQRQQDLDANEENVEVEEQEQAERVSPSNKGQEEAEDELLKELLIVDENELEPELVVLEDEVNPQELQTLEEEELNEENETGETGVNDGGEIMTNVVEGENETDVENKQEDLDEQDEDVFHNDKEQEGLMSTRVGETNEEKDEINKEGDESLSTQQSPILDSILATVEDEGEVNLLHGESRHTTRSEDNDEPMNDKVLVSPPHPVGSSHSIRSIASLTKSQRDEKEDEKEEKTQNEEVEQSTGLNREQLLEQYHVALVERQHTQDQNYQLQHKLADYFRRKNVNEGHPDDRSTVDQEQRYLKFMATLDDLRREERHSAESYRALHDDGLSECERRQMEIETETTRLVALKNEIALTALSSRTGKPMAAKEIEMYLEKDMRVESEVRAVRLENIKLKNRLKKKECQLRSKEELAEGLHLIDFEQLKIENQTYNEKIEERNEELIKLRKKITSTVEVLTHLKEKLQFVQTKNQAEKVQLYEVEEAAARKRDALSRIKQVRDALRADNHRLKQMGGLLGNESLLADYETRADESTELRAHINQLKVQHAELTLNLDGVRRKIAETKSG